MKPVLTLQRFLTVSIHVLAAMAVVLSAMVPYSLLAAKYVPPLVSLGIVGVVVLGGAVISVPIARRVVRWLQSQDGVPDLFDKNSSPESTR